MNDLSFSENYVLLLLSATGKRTNIKDAQYSAGIVLGGIYDLLKSGCVSVNGGGRLKAVGALPAEYSCLRVLYTGIRQNSKKMSKWLEYYCFSASTKNIRLLINDIYDELSEKGFVDIEVKRGILKTKTTLHLNLNEVTPIVEDFQQGVLNKESDEKVIFSLQMLSLAEVLKNIFPVRHRMKVKSAVSYYRKCRIWNDMEPYVKQTEHIIANNNFMSASLSGAFYDGN